MPEFEPVGKVIHRTDAKVVALPWSYIYDNLASDSYFKVEFRQPGSHNKVDVMTFIVKEGDKFKVITTIEVFDVSFPHGKEKRVMLHGHTHTDPLPFDTVAEAQTAAKIEAVLHHAHTRQFKPLALPKPSQGRPNEWRASTIHVRS